MQVEFINRDYMKENFFTQWGIAAATCYNSDLKYAERIGKSCLSTKHFSGCRGLYFSFKISDVPRSLVDQLVRHEVGVFKNVQSFRYVSKDSFAYYTPSLIANCPNALAEYNRIMTEIASSYAKIQGELREFYAEDISSGKYSDEDMNQSARGVIPMNTNTELVIGFTLEALINLMEKRLCSRAEEAIRLLTHEIKKILIQDFPEFTHLFRASCFKLSYCPEGKKCCGMFPTKVQYEQEKKDFMDYILKKRLENKEK